MSKYLIRLDDASEYMNLNKWKQMEDLLDKYEIKPIFGIIPDNQDPKLRVYEKNDRFWELAHSWIQKGWIPAMHGYEHRYVTKCGGINPVNKKSEFAGLSYMEQADKIRKGYKILEEHGVTTQIFFAPSHTFDKNTLKAIENETPIRIISDTPAWDIYKKGKFWFIPQQSGCVRVLPFKTVTFCYHPNSTDEKGFIALNEFFLKFSSKFVDLDLFSVKEKNREASLIDRIIKRAYFSCR